MVPIKYALKITVLYYIMIVPSAFSIRAKVCVLLGHNAQNNGWLILFNKS